MKSIALGMRLMLALLLLGRLSAPAAEWSFRAPHDAVPHNAEEYEWKEERIDLPAYPDREKMFRINFDRPNSRFEFFIDLETLSVGEDGVVRYVMILRSTSGSENVMFEGIRCTRRDYKTFAFGTAKQQFRQLSKPVWKEITQTSNNWFRYDLWKDYFCGGGELASYALLTRDNILQRFGNPETQSLNN